MQNQKNMTGRKMPIVLQLSQPQDDGGTDRQMPVVLQHSQLQDEGGTNRQTIVLV